MSYRKLLYSTKLGLTKNNIHGFRYHPSMTPNIIGTQHVLRRNFTRQGWLEDTQAMS